MSSYHHLSQIQRYQIQALYGTNTTRKAIAQQVGCHPDTIKRELKRGRTSEGRYCAEYAQAASQQRTSASRNARKICHAILARVQRYLALDLSPEQVAKRMALEQADQRISHETIYQRIYSDPLQLGARLRRNCVKRRRCGHTPDRVRIPERVDIEQRPAVVEQKLRLGDYEGDTVVGGGHRGAVVTMVDRCSRFTMAKVLARRTAPAVSSAMIEMFAQHPHACHTVTLDNGMEFAGHQQVTQSTGIAVYFAKPYKPWQRGLNENTNGLLRQYIPKGTSMRDLTDTELQGYVDRLNHRPRKCLGYKTPHEVFFNKPVSPLTL